MESDRADGTYPMAPHPHKDFAVKGYKKLGHVPVFDFLPDNDSSDVGDAAEGFALFAVCVRGS